MKKTLPIISASFFLILSITTYAQTSPKKSTVIISESEIISLANTLKKYRKTTDFTDKGSLKTQINSSISAKKEIDSLNRRITVLTELLAAQKEPLTVSKTAIQKTTTIASEKKQLVETSTIPSKEIEKTINAQKPTNNNSELSALQQEISELKLLVAAIAEKQNTSSISQIQPATATQPIAETKTIIKEIPVYSEKIITKTDTVYILKTNDSFKTLDSLNMKLLNVKNNLIKEQKTEIELLKNQLLKKKVTAPIKVEDKIKITTSKLFFNNNEFTLNELNSSLLDELIVNDLVVSKFQFHLKGYSSNSGNANYNSILSKKRTQSVADYLISKGISAKAIKTESFGVDLSAKNESKARRVEIEITKMP